MVQVRNYNPIISLEQKPVDKSTDEEKEVPPFHKSENYTKRSLYKRWITTKTEEISLLAIVKDMKRETKEGADNGILLRRIQCSDPTWN